MRNYILHFFFIWVGIFASHGSYSQNESIELLSTASSTFYSSDYSLDWIIGELVVTSSEETNFSQGFLVYSQDRVTGVPHEKLLNVNVYPNPAEDALFISNHGNKISTIVLFNVVGKEVIQTDFKEKIDCSFLKPGIYHVLGFSESGEAIFKKKIIKM